MTDLLWVPSVDRVEDLPANASDDTHCYVSGGALFADTVWVRVGGTWWQAASLPQPPESPTEAMRRVVTCAGCGASVSPEAERCEHCRSYLEP